jgi:hypothetical protein
LDGGRLDPGHPPAGAGGAAAFRSARGRKPPKLGYNRFMISLVALAALLAAPVRAQEAPLVEIVSRRVILPASFIPVTPTGAATAPLALIVEQGSGWDSSGSLEKTLGKASAIFARCGVTLGEAEVVTVRWSAEGLKRLNVVDPYAGPSEMNVMGEALLPARRPIGFLFAKSSIPSTAKAYNKSTVETFEGQYPDARRLLDTFWITIDQQTRPRRPDELASFSVFAHELTHILGNLPHTPARPNLMTDSDLPGSKSGDLLEEQCAAIRRLD